ncbi:MAG: sulfur carrier protein ThiS [Methylobacteriaceae bacterium]|nr:sulfur carrier protein ThiS [Methylobacteriaceae bacterium]
MRITINGQARECEPATLQELWRSETEHLDLAGPRGFAIARNGRVVRQLDWGSTSVAAGDRIEIIRVMPGG